MKLEPWNVFVQNEKQSQIDANWLISSVTLLVVWQKHILEVLWTFYRQNNLICKVTSDSSFHITSQNNKSNLQYLPELLWRRSKGWGKKAKRFIAPHICTSPLASKDFFQVHKQSLTLQGRVCVLSPSCQLWWSRSVASRLVWSRSLLSSSFSITFCPFSPILFSFCAFNTVPLRK